MSVSKSCRFALTLLWLAFMGRIGAGSDCVSRFPQPLVNAGGLVVDFNSDSHLDLVSSNRIQLGDGEGGFSNPGPVSGSLSTLAFGDINNDGYLDIAMGAGGPYVSVQFGNGQDSLSAPTQYFVGSFPEDLAVGDMSGDGVDDLCVTNLSNYVTVIVNDGAGGVGLQASYSAPGGPDDISLGDVDADGDLDVAVVNSQTSSVSVLLGDGAGALSVATSTALPGPGSLLFYDVDGVAGVDLVVTNPTQDVLSILYSDGAGGFASVSSKAVPGLGADLAIAPTGELVVNASSFDPAGLSTPSAIFKPGGSVGDFNSDGSLDLVKYPYLKVGDGNGGLIEPVSYPKISSFVAGESGGLVLGDLNGDSNVDVLSGGWVWLADGIGGFHPGKPSGIVSGGSSYSLGDLNGDSILDAVTPIWWFQGEVAVSYGNGLGGFGSEKKFPTNDFPWSVALGDINGDSFLDIAAASSNGYSFVSILLGDGAGDFAAFSTVYYPPVAVLEKVAIADLDLDAVPDLIAVGKDLHFARGGGPFSGFDLPVKIPLAFGPNDFVIEDVDSDGAIDVVVGGADGVWVLFNDGPGLQLSLAQVSESGSGSIAVGDINNDGLPDIIAKTAGGFLVCEGLGSRTFGVGAAFGPTPGAFAVVDVDHDGFMDVVSPGLLVHHNLCSCTSPMYGDGCPGALGFVPVLSIAGCLVGGGTISFKLSRAAGPSVAAIVMGAGPYEFEIGSGCDLLVGPLLPPTLVLPVGGSGAGNGELTIPITLPPSVPIGSIAVQALIADSSVDLGFSASNGVVATFLP